MQGLRKVATIQQLGKSQLLEVPQSQGFQH